MQIKLQPLKNEQLANDSNNKYTLCSDEQPPYVLQYISNIGKPIQMTFVITVLYPGNHLPMWSTE